jgi:hypothetical protein
MLQRRRILVTAWERRVEGCFFTLCSFEPYMVGHSHDDGNPIQKGVAIPEPVLGHAYEISADDGDNFGSTIAVGDFNGDGYDDIADNLQMNDSQAGHPAGGMVTTPQDLITLFREGWRHPLFRKFAGANISCMTTASNSCSRPTAVAITLSPAVDRSSLGPVRKWAISSISRSTP